MWFKPPPRDQALDWLARQRNAPAKCSVLLDLAAGAPLLALALHDGDFFEQREQLLSDIAALRAGRTSPVECAVRWKALGAARVLGWLQAAVADMIRLALDADAPILANPDCRDRLQSITNGLKLNDLFPFFDEVSETRGLLAGPLDELLLLENLLIRWSRMSA